MGAGQRLLNVLVDDRADDESKAEDAQYVDQARRLDHYGERVGEQPVQGLDEAAEFVRKIHVFHEHCSSTGSAFRLSVVNDNRPM